MTQQQRIVTALNQADKECTNGICIHQKALESVRKLLDHAIITYANECFEKKTDPLIGSFEYGLHVGYKLAQIDQEEPDVSRQS